jgi:hypothetical protein
VRGVEDVGASEEAVDVTKIPTTPEMVDGVRRRLDRHVAACDRCQAAADDPARLCAVGRAHHGRWVSLRRDRDLDRAGT